MNFEHRFDPEIGLLNPYSKVTCFLLYLYSMEFGSPPLYVELNRVTRDMDMSQLENLGPLLKAMTPITGGAEKERHNDDKIKTGEHWGGVKFNMAGGFLLFRGVQMAEE